MTDSGVTPPPAEPEGRAPEPSRPAGPPSIAGLFVALARRPLLVLGGALLCGLVTLLGQALGAQTADSLFSLASYLPILGGAWAVWAAATVTKSQPRGHWPERARVICYAATAFVILVLSGVVGIAIPVVGAPATKTLLALGPTVALAELAWPPAAIWRGVLAIDRQPRSYAILFGISALVLLITFVPRIVAGGAHSPGFVDGLSRGLGWAVISALWMRFYLLQEAETEAS